MVQQKALRYIGGPEDNCDFSEIYTNDEKLKEVLNDKFRKEPDAGKPHVRFREGHAQQWVCLLDQCVNEEYELYTEK